MALQMEKEPERRYRSTYTDARALLQNGFPRDCCDTDECDPAKQIYKNIHMPRWLSDLYDPYDAGDPKEPVGPIPIVMDLHYDRQTGVMKMALSNIVVHDGVIHKVLWDLNSRPGSFEDAPEEPGVDLDYNKDYLEQDLIDIQQLGNICADQCAELGIGNCAPACVADKHAGYTLTGSETAVAASEQDAIDAALTAAELAATCDDNIIELCYTKLQIQAQGGGYTAVAGIYCREES